MTATRYTQLSCDFTGCSRAFSDIGTASDVRHRAHNVGDVDGRWNADSRHDWCPDHKTRASRMFIAAPEVV